MRRFHIIDCLGPFAVRSRGETVNWSKVDFSSLETGGRLPARTRRRIVRRFARYAEKIAGLGCDSISLDDLAHLVVFDFYSPGTRTLLQDYRALYSELFAVARQYKLKVFVNTDYLFSNSRIEKHLEDTNTAPADFFAAAVEQMFGAFPGIEGVILRIGENDGRDVSGTFLSKLLLKTPAQANKLLNRILPLFEERGKTLVFRTWTVGVYPIGDLIWNEQTFDAVFSSVQSDALVISMKFGDTDFMRHLSLNPLFFRGPHKKMLELQTRREWEGMGVFPSFVGWDYQKYWRELDAAKNIAGVHIWCQTGGWAKQAWSNTTFFGGSSLWNELNTEMTIRVVKYGSGVEPAIRRFCKTRGIRRQKEFIELLRLSETAVKKGLYISDMAGRQLYFRRTRIPPLTWLMWDTPLLTAPVRSIHQALSGPQQAIFDEGDQAAATAGRMVQAARACVLEASLVNSVIFEQQTLEIFAQLRRYLYGQLSDGATADLNKQITAYRRRWPQAYRIPRLQPAGKTPGLLALALRLFVRDSPRYRNFDKLLLRTSWIQSKIIIFYMRTSKSKLAGQTMGLDMLFK